MLRIPNPRRSPGLFVAILALFIALGGSAIAAGVFSGPQRKQVRKIATKVFNGRIGGATVAHAGNADELGGVEAFHYQQQVQGTCPSGIQDINTNGIVNCAASPVKAISMVPNAGNNVSQLLGSGLQLVTVCHDGATVEMAFQNLGSSGATLNWFFSDGTTVSATGINLPASGEHDFGFSTKRIEGQFIYSVGANVITINLHAFDGGTFCEVKGTTESASS